MPAAPGGEKVEKYQENGGQKRGKEGQKRGHMKLRRGEKRETKKE